MALKYDEILMNQLLAEPGLQDLVQQMTPETLEWFKESLVREGLYKDYVNALALGV